MSTISKDNIDNIEKLIKKLQILDEIWQSLVDEPRERIRGLIPVFNKLIREGYPDYKFKQMEIKDFLKERVNHINRRTSTGYIYMERRVIKKEEKQ